MVRVHLPKKQGHVGGGMEGEGALWARKEGADERERTGVSVRARGSLHGGRDAVEEQRWGGQRVGRRPRQCFYARLRLLRPSRKQGQEDCDSRAGQSRAYRSGTGGATWGAGWRGVQGEDAGLEEVRCGGKRSWGCGDRGPG
jgi:hypothetical protein